MPSFQPLVFGVSVAGMGCWLSTSQGEFSQTGGKLSGAGQGPGVGQDPQGCAVSLYLDSAGLGLALDQTPLTQAALCLGWELSRSQGILRDSGHAFRRL